MELRTRQHYEGQSLAGHPRFTKAGANVIGTLEIRRACAEFFERCGLNVEYAEIIAASQKAEIEERKRNE
jgi:hypothetical protein